jgi:hypothetical protein
LTLASDFSKSWFFIEGIPWYDVSLCRRDGGGYNGGFFWTSYYDSCILCTMSIGTGYFAKGSVRQDGAKQERTRCGASLPRRSPKGKRVPHICFYETNPPFFRDFSNATSSGYRTYDENLQRNSVGSFSKTNPLNSLTCFRHKSRMHWTLYPKNLEKTVGSFRRNIYGGPSHPSVRALVGTSCCASAPALRHPVAPQHETWAQKPRRSSPS